MTISPAALARAQAIAAAAPPATPAQIALVRAILRPATTTRSNAA